MIKNGNLWTCVCAVLILGLAVGGFAQEASVFETPVKIQAGGKDIKVDRGHSHPFLYDYDKDGKLDLLVTPDTGPLHIAAAMNTATLAISVAGIAVESNPRSNSTQHVFVQKQKTCKPCIDKKCKYQKCMLQITSDEVFEQICNTI